MKYAVKLKTKESDIALSMVTSKNKCTLSLKRCGDFSTHHAIEDSFTVLTQLAEKVGCCHNSKEYWERLEYIARDKRKMSDVKSNP